MWLSVFSHLASGPRPHVHVRRDVSSHVCLLTDCGNTLKRGASRNIRRIIRAARAPYVARGFQWELIFVIDIFVRRHRVLDHKSQDVSALRRELETLRAGCGSLVF